MSGSSDWTEERLALLRHYWLVDKLSGAEIGRRMDISKNAVLGKVYRLGLDARPSPIKARAADAPVPVKRRKQALRAFEGALALTSAVARAALEPVVVTSTARPTPCKWPIGDPRKASFSFCNDLSVPGRPYCEPHCAVAYVRERRCAV